MSEAKKISLILCQRMLVMRPLAKHCNDTHRNDKNQISGLTKRIKCDYKLHHFCVCNMSSHSIFGLALISEMHN
jgi:hypothetical protein